MAGTRSRPYHSDDNAHVEHKNWMWPRQLLGYGGLKPEELVGTAIYLASPASNYVNGQIIYVDGGWLAVL